MTTYIISIISLTLAIQLKATRLLQIATCTSTLCVFGTQCYETSNGPICCDPNICQKGRCGGNGLQECEPDYECVVSDCPPGMTDCPGNCVNPNAKPQIGDPCTRCIRPLCPCSLCPDGQNAYGCCGGCEYRDDGQGYIICTAGPITDLSDCPPYIAPATSESCGTQGLDCDTILAPRNTCSDGTCWGNCGTCLWQEDVPGNMNCAPAFIAKEDVCPCGGFENCDSYTPDGCNTCGCPKDGTLSFCTLMGCAPELQTKPECRVCSDGYTLNPLTKECEQKLTCANALCVFGETCYETSNGPACCDANICQNGICGTRTGIECTVGYECVEDAFKTCNPVTTADCPGVCVNIDAKPNVGCDIDNCDRYFNGCNDCNCNVDGTESCTEKLCKQYLDPYCTGCKPGYILNPSTNKCEGCICPAVATPMCCDGVTYSNSCVASCQQATGVCSYGLCVSPATTTAESNPNICCNPIDRPGFNGNPLCSEGAACCPDGKWRCSIADGRAFLCDGVLLDSAKDEMGKPCCNGFANCKSYYDGCNNCVCGENGVDVCALGLCEVEGIPKCNECEFEYRVNDETGQCVPKISCNFQKECDWVNGFRCRDDPMCKGEGSLNPLCQTSTKVCFDYEPVRCENDLECDTNNGFKCVAVNQSIRRCGRYQ